MVERMSCQALGKASFFALGEGSSVSAGGVFPLRRLAALYSAGVCFKGTVLMKFADLGLAETLLRAVEAEGYHTATPVQIAAIPPILTGATSWPVPKPAPERPPPSPCRRSSGSARRRRQPEFADAKSGYWSSRPRGNWPAKSAKASEPTAGIPRSDRPWSMAASVRDRRSKPCATGLIF